MYKLQRYLLTPTQLTAELETARALTYLRAYMAALPLGQEFPSTELQPADDLILLAAQAYVNAWRFTGESKLATRASSVNEKHPLL